jgi:hypothetical protein
VDEIVSYEHQFKTVLAFYSFVVGARFFKAFSYQARLALVTKTLALASVDLIHFGVVLSVTIFVFTVPAYILFCGQMVEFESLGRAYVSVWRAMLGDFDYVASTAAGRPQATVWWVFFMVLVHMIMLNMMIAIILDVYMKLKAATQADHAPTIWSQS